MSQPRTLCGFRSRPARILPAWEAETDTKQALATCWATARCDQVASGCGGMLVAVATIAMRTSGP